MRFKRGSQWFWATMFLLFGIRLVEYVVILVADGFRPLLRKIETDAVSFFWLGICISVLVAVVYLSRIALAALSKRSQAVTVEHR